MSIQLELSVNPHVNTAMISATFCCCCCRCCYWYSGLSLFVFVATSVPAETDLKSQRKKKVEEYVVTLKKKGFKGADEVIVLAYVDPL